MALTKTRWALPDIRPETRISTRSRRVLSPTPPPTRPEPQGAGPRLDEDEAEGDGNSTQGKKASGHGKIVGAFRKVAKKAAVFRGDVHVEGEPTTKQKVGNKIDRLLHHSRAKDEMTPYCESGSSRHADEYACVLT
mgnify:CR=1 FL=1